MTTSLSRRMASVSNGLQQCDVVTRRPGRMCARARPRARIVCICPSQRHIRFTILIYKEKRRDVLCDAAIASVTSPRNFATGHRRQPIPCQSTRLNRRQRGRGVYLPRAGRTTNRNGLIGRFSGVSLWFDFFALNSWFQVALQIFTEAPPKIFFMGGRKP